MSVTPGGSAAATGSRWEVEEEAMVEQITVPGSQARLLKSRLRLASRLSVVRKRLPGVEGAPVVLVHGFAQNRYTWHSSGRSMSAWLASQGLDVYVLELRGHGNSRASGAPERFADYVEDAAELAEAIGQPAFWVGHSLGGSVAYALATRSPVRGVIGIGAVYRFGQHNRVVNWLTRASHLARARGLLGGLSVRTRLAGQVLGRLYGISDIAGYAFPVSGWAPGSLEPELLAERLERGFDWTSLHVWLDMSRWAHDGGFDYAPEWAHTDVPLLVITGDLDHLMPPSDARAAFTESGSRDKQLLELEPWSTGTHWGHLDLVSGKQAPEHVWAPVSAWMGLR